MTTSSLGEWQRNDADGFIFIFIHFEGNYNGKWGNSCCVSVHHHHQHPVSIFGICIRAGREEGSEKMIMIMCWIKQANKQLRFFCPLFLMRHPHKSSDNSLTSRRFIPFRLKIYNFHNFSLGMRKNEEFHAERESARFVTSASPSIHLPRLAVAGVVYCLRALQEILILPSPFHLVSSLSQII